MIGADHHGSFQSLLERHRRFVLTTHVNPDGDAIGSEMGLARFLRSRGAEVRIVNQDATPDTLRFLESDELRVEVYDEGRHAAAFQEAERLVLLDNSAPDRFGRVQPRLADLAAKTFCIDHHPTRGTPWAETIIDDASCATAEIIYELATRTGWRPDRAAAEALYVGISTDTGVFRFNSTTPRAHEIAAELLRLGVQPAHAYQEIYERNSASYTRLLGQALSSLRLDAGGAVASVRITRAMLEASDGDGVDSSEMTTALLAMDGVRVALLFRELPGGRIKVSLRSKGDLDVHRLASGFGGGGHRNASGIVLAGALDEVSERIIAEAKRPLGA
jgi:bifunctional oligoribonuclease and PAP phosphatase NrnA